MLSDGLRGFYMSAPLDDGFTIRPARPADVGLVLAFIRQLAEYEKLSHEVVADEATLHEALFGPKANAEALLGEIVTPSGRETVAFAVFFHNFSTFLGRRGLYLEDLFVQPQHRGAGYGRRMLAHLAKLALERGCRRFEWAVLDWNAPALGFYAALGAEAKSDWVIHRLSGAALAELAAEAR
jgi:GNAT superfamily N-acetyltransferase